jgi:hypothetical protein
VNRRSVPARRPAAAALASAGDHAADLAIEASARLLPVAAALLVVAGLNLAAASCTPEPAPYAARTTVERTPSP